MKTRSLKLQITTIFILLLSISMFMLSCVWVMLTQKVLIEKEIVLLEGYADTLGKDLHDGDVACYQIHPGETRLEALNPKKCSSTSEEISRQVIGGGEGTEKTVAYSGTQWAVLTFSHKNLIVAKPVSSENGDLNGSIVIETALEPLYQTIRDNWKIVICYLIINVIIFASLGLLRMFKLVVRPIDRLIDISTKFSPQGELSFYSGNSNNEFSKLSHGLNRMVNRIRADNKALSATVEALENANRELKRNKSEMIRTEKLASVGRLSAGLAHEIGNPLGIVQGYVDMLGASELTSQEKRQFSERAKSELQRIDTLIHQLLDMSRKEDGVNTTIHVQQLLEKVLDFFSLQKKNLKIRIITDFKAIDDRVAVHEDQLRQVFLNCLMNATDAIAELGEKDKEDEQGKIDIICENVILEGEEYVQVRVVDNGPGVDSTLIDNIFDPFFTTKETGKGTGLGLYVSYTIMENLGGSIRFNNLQPAGAEVVIQLPCI